MFVRPVRSIPNSSAELPRDPVATILPTVTVTKYKPAPSIAYFSARGPAYNTKNLLKVKICPFLLYVKPLIGLRNGVDCHKSQFSCSLTLQHQGLTSLQHGLLMAQKMGNQHPPSTYSLELQWPALIYLELQPQSNPSIPRGVHLQSDQPS